jgi:glycosyltransferase involved in cell wall biosynthesis
VKVWLVNQYAIPPSQSGGTRHYSLARALEAHGVGVEIFSSTRNYLTGDTIAAPGSATCGGVRFTFVDAGRAPTVGRRSGRLAAMVGFWRALRRVLRGRPDAPDVIVGSTPSPFAAWGAETEARRLGVPFVLEIRDLWPQTLIDLGSYPRWHPGVLLFGAIERRLYRRAAHIVSLLPHADRHIERVLGRRAAVTWIPNGIDLRLARAALGEAAATGDGAPPDPFVVRYAGAHGPANALDALLDAAALLEHRRAGGYRLELIGDGHDKARLAARARAERLGNVRFHEAVPKAEVYRLLADADALIVNMNRGKLYQSGISFNKIYDYLAVGRPIVFGTDSINNPVAEAGAGVTVAANDARALADGIEEVARLSPADREAMGSRGRAFVEAHHDIEALAARFAEVLRKV